MALRVVLQSFQCSFAPVISSAVSQSGPAAFWGCNQQQVRYRKANRNWNEKWRGFRALKVF